jgi:tetratricopeptide (TPR) repeat protein
MRVMGWRRICRTVTLGAFVLVAACSSPEEREARYLERGISLFEAGDDTSAMVELRNVLQLNPKNVEALYHVARIHERADRLPEAAAAYQDVVTEQPDFVPAQARLGALALVFGDLETAAAAAQQIEAVEPDNPDGLAIRGSLALRRGDTQGALDLAHAALEVTPQHEQAVAVVAGAYHRLGEGARAVERLDEAIAANPETVALRMLKIMLLEERIDAGEPVDVEPVIATYHELFQLEPDDSLHRLALADFHRRQGESGQAQAVLRSAILDDGLQSPSAAAGLVRLVYAEKGLEAAVAELKQLIERRPEDDASLRFLLADLYASDQRYDEAEAVMAPLLAEDHPAVNDALAGLARIRFAAGDEDGAREAVGAALESDPGHRGANLVMGTLFLREGRYEDAIRSARTALRQNPNWAPALRLVAEAHLAQGERRLAIDSLGRAVQLDPTDGRSAARLAELLTEEGAHAAALRLWDRVALLAEDPSQALRARASLEMQQRNFAAAQADINELLAIPGQEWAGALLAGDLLLLQSRFEESREWFARASSLNPDAPHPVLGVARAHLAAGDPEEALAYLEERTRERPDDAIAFDLLGDLLARQGRPDEAETAFRQAIELQPAWPMPYRHLGRMLREGGEPERAIEVYLAALEQQPDEPNLLNELAYTRYAAGAYAEAADTYEHLIAVVPGFDLPAYNYAAMVALFLYDEPERLERAFAIASERFRGSSDPYRLDVLGWLHYHKGEYAAALPFLERAVRLAGSDPELRYHLGMALFRVGQEQRALEELEKALAADHEFAGLDEARAIHARLQQDPGGG